MVYIIYYILYIIYNINLLYMSHIRYYIYNIYYMLHLIYYIKPHPIYNIPGGVSLSLSLSLYIYIYMYMRAGQTSPHMEYGTRYDFYLLSEKWLPVDIILWLIRRFLETIWRFEVTHIVPNFSNL